MPQERLDLTGQCFGLFKVVSFYGINKHGATCWNCVCDCGKETVEIGSLLLKGRKTSCGCQRKQKEIKDITGNQYGKMTVISFDREEKNEKGWRTFFWNCLCNECGNHKIISSRNLATYKEDSTCGCTIGNKNRIDITGKRFNRLVALKPIYIKGQETVWECICDCGVTKNIKLKDLQYGSTQSCGCLHKDLTIERSTKHGHTSKFNGGKTYGTRTYKTWRSMKERCLNPDHPAYHNYGGRGITVCDRWLNSFENFLEDMGEKPVGLTLERVNNMEGYGKANCVYTTQQSQTWNTRKNFLIEYRGEIRCLGEWFDILTKEGNPPKVTHGAVHARISRKGWTAEQAFYTPRLK